MGPVLKRPALKKYGEIRPDLSTNSPNLSAFTDIECVISSVLYFSGSAIIRGRRSTLKWMNIQISNLISN